MPKYQIETRMVSNPIYIVDAPSKKEAMRIIDEEGGVDPFDENVIEERIISVEKIG